MMQTLLELLESEWYAEKAAEVGGPTLKRVWNLAVHERNKGHKGRVSDYELFGLV